VLSDQEMKEKSHHYSLMLTSTLALYLLAFLLSTLFCYDILTRLTFTYIYVGSFLQSSVWTDYLITAHPDHLFALTTAFATALTFKLFQYPQNKKYFTASAAMWGVATATKMTMVLFIPAILFILVYPWTKNNFKSVIKYILTMFTAYQIIGFPQNLSMHRHIGFMLHQSHNSVAPDLVSILRWLNLTYDQIAYPLLITIFLLLLFRRPAKKFKIHRALLFIVTPYLVLISRKIMSVHDYYPMPFISVFIVGFIIIFSIFKHSRPLPNKVKYLLPFICFFVSSYFFNTNMQQSFAKSLNKYTSCRQEAREVNTKIKEFQIDNRVIQVDPYFPAGNEKNTTLRKWGYTLEQFQKNNPSIIGLRQKFYSRYLKDAPSFLKAGERANWNNIGDYYRLFHNKQEVIFDNVMWKKSIMISAIL
jgi:hypothetical protein